MKVDVNADLGEGFGPYRIADDEALMRIVTSANIACGFHAGDPQTMDRMVGLAKDLGVAVGAHVGYPDRVGFGRRQMAVSPADLRNDVLFQLGALAAFAKVHGTRVAHLSPHGALGNLASADRSVAEAIVSAASAFDPDIAYLTMTGTAMEDIVRERGLKSISSFLADRAYLNDGQLVPRSRAGAVVKDISAIRDRVRRAVSDGEVETIDGAILKIEVQSVLVHSDTPNAVSIAMAVKDAIGASRAD